MVAVTAENALVTARAFAVTALALLAGTGGRVVDERKFHGARLALHAACSNRTATAGCPHVDARRLAANTARHTAKLVGFAAAALGRANSLLLRASNVMF